MNAQHDLLSYLQEQAGKGVKDSEGDFTISHLNARKKLARFALPRETAWVSKLVQAAVGWKMSGISLGQSQNETQIFFQTPNPGALPTERDVVGALLSGKVVAETPLDHFCLGLRSLVEQATLSFILVINGGDTKPQPIYAGEHYGQMSEQARLDSRFDRGPGITLTVRHSPPLDGNTPVSELLGLHKHGLPIIQELRDYAYPCPIPIVQAGFHLEGIMDSPLIPSNVVPLVISGIDHLDHSPQRLALPPKYEEKQLSFLTHPRRARRSYGGKRGFACAYVLTAASPSRSFLGSYRRSSIKWVRDGIVVQESSLDIRTETLSLFILANAEGLKTDLTGFQLVQEEALHSRRSEILRDVGESVMCWYEKIDGFFREDRDSESYADEEFDKDQAFRSRVKRLLKGSAAGIAITLLNPPFGLATTFGSMASAYLPHFLKSGTPQALSRREFLISKIKNDLLLLSQNLTRIARETEESMSKGMTFEQFDPADASAISDLKKAFDNDPVLLAEALRKLVGENQDQPMWHLHLARAYREGGDNRASIHFNRYLDFVKDAGAFEELANFYDETNRAGLANLVRTRKDNPSNSG